MRAYIIKITHSRDKNFGGVNKNFKFKAGEFQQCRLKNILLGELVNPILKTAYY